MEQQSSLASLSEQLRDSKSCTEEDAGGATGASSKPALFKSLMEIGEEKLPQAGYGSFH